MGYSKQGNSDLSKNNGATGELFSVEQYFTQQGLTDDTVQIVESQENPIEEYCDRHNLHKGTLKTVEPPQDSELKLSLGQSTSALYVLLTPAFIAPFWLMWILSPGNIDTYTLVMRAALLATLAANLLGLCWIFMQSSLNQAE